MVGEAVIGLMQRHSISFGSLHEASPPPPGQNPGMSPVCPYLLELEEVQEAPVGLGAQVAPELNEPSEFVPVKP